MRSIGVLTAATELRAQFQWFALPFWLRGLQTEVCRGVLQRKSTGMLAISGFRYTAVCRNATLAGNGNVTCTIFFRNMWGLLVYLLVGQRVILKEILKSRLLCGLSSTGAGCFSGVGFVSTAWISVFFDWLHNCRLLCFVYFSFCLTKCRVFTLGSGIVSPALRFRVTAMFVLLIAGNLNPAGLEWASVACFKAHNFTKTTLWTLYGDTIRLCGGKLPLLNYFTPVCVYCDRGKAWVCVQAISIPNPKRNLARSQNRYKPACREWMEICFVCCYQEAVSIGVGMGWEATVFEWQINGLNFLTVNTVSFYC